MAMRRAVTSLLPGFRTSVLIGLSLILGILMIASMDDTKPSPLRISINQNDHKPIPKVQSYNHKAHFTKSPFRSFPYTNFSKSVDTPSNQTFWDSIHPGFKCPPNLLTRVGRETGDGGKWMCGLETLGRRKTKDGRNCTLYSFGVFHDSTFESAVMDTAQCSMYAYDPTVDKIGHPLKMSDPRVHFQKLGIAGANTENMRTLKTFMDENGHKFIDILKVDVEGAEYESFDKMFQDFDQLPFGQLLVEFHSMPFKKEERKRKMMSYLMRLEVMGARIFSVEANSRHPYCCAELSFINLNYIKLFFPDENRI